MPIAPREEPTTALAAFGVHAGPRAGEEILVRSPVVTIGQGSQNDIVLNDDSVSTMHARLEYDAAGWRITDLGSTNGTYVEGTRLTPNIPTPLAYSAMVRFGGLTLQFRAVEAADPETARAHYTPPRPPTSLSERAGGFRLPVWLFLLILIALGIVLFFVLDGPSSGAVGLSDAMPPVALLTPPSGGP